MNICESGNECDLWSSHEGTRGDGMGNPLPSVSSTKEGLHDSQLLLWA